MGPYPLEFSGQASKDLVERIQWTFPIIFSPVDPHVLYTASQHLWRTTNGGNTWDKMGGDALTRHDPKTMGDSGGPITHDMNSPEVYATVFAIGPGKTDVNVIWTGSDDGIVSVTRDGGKTFANVTPKDMPDLGRVSIIDASKFDAGSAYVAVKKPLLEDYAPYIFRTHDFGKTWTKIVNGIAANDYVHVVREDPARKGLLYAGTQHSVYISFDDGDHWQSLALNLPDTQVSDLMVVGDDLTISTHGRGFYILDHIWPIRQSGPDLLMADTAFLFHPPDAIRSGPVPMNALNVTYLVRKPVDSLTIDIIDPKGTVVQSFVGSNAAPAAAPAAAGRGGRGGGGGGGRGGGGRGGPQPASMTIGFNTVSWNLRYPGAVTFPGMILWGGGGGAPEAAPGTYTVKMTVDGKTQTQMALVKRNPLFVGLTDAELQAQFDLAVQVRDKASEANGAVIQIRAIKSAVDDRLSKSQDAALKAKGETLKQHLTDVEGQIYQIKNQSSQDTLNFPIQTNNRLESLRSMVMHGDGPPQGTAPEILKNLTAELKAETDQLAKVISTDLAAFNVEIKRLGLDAVSDKG